MMRDHRIHLRPRGRAFTIVELLIVVSVLAIAAAVAVPRMGSTTDSKLRAAASLLAADLGYAQVESIAHGDDTRLVTFDTSTATYYLSAASAPTTPLTNPVGKSPYSVTFGGGHNQQLSGVSIKTISVGGDTKLVFGSFGETDQTTDATITLACGANSVTLTVSPAGQVSIGSIK